MGGEGGTSTIAGDSVFGFTLGKISRKDPADLPANDPGLLITGMYEYCDELGTHFVRTFDLRYRNNALPVASVLISLMTLTLESVLSQRTPLRLNIFPHARQLKNASEIKSGKRSSKPCTNFCFKCLALSRSHIMVHAPDTANQNLFRARSLNPSALGQLKEQAPAHWRLRWNTRSLRCWY
jgi:hypothetical protein